MKAGCCDGDRGHVGELMKIGARTGRRHRARCGYWVWALLPLPLLGCARVSKGDEQNDALQTKALRAAGCRRLFEETASGGRWDRPELHRLLDHLRDDGFIIAEE